jgi:hypothetical protein
VVEREPSFLIHDDGKTIQSHMAMAREREQVSMDELERALGDPGIAHVPEVALAVRKLMAPRQLHEIQRD